VKIVNRFWSYRFKLYLIIFILFLSNLLIFGFINDSKLEVNLNNQSDNLTYKLGFCEQSVNPDFESAVFLGSNINYSYSYAFVDIIPELKNAQCLGKIIDVWNVEGEENTFHFIYGSNQKIYDYLKILGNLLIISSIFYVKKFSVNFNLIKYLIIFAGINFNFINELLFNRIPGSLLVNLEENFITLLTYGVIFISMSTKNLKIIIFGCIFLLTFNYDYLGVYLFLYILINKLDIFIPVKVNPYIFSLLPIFLISRFLASLSEQFNVFWERLFQSSYRGFSRFIDLQADFYVLNCNSGYAPPSYKIKFIETVNYCEATIGYGPIRKIITLNGDIWQIVLLFIFSLFLIILFQYREIVKRYPKELFIVTILFISPSVNMLIHLSNPDIFYFALIYFVLNKYKQNPILNSGIIYLFSLWKIHAIGIIVGLILCSLVLKNYKVLKINVFYLLATITTYIVDTQTTEPLKIPDAPDERHAYGMLHDSLQLTKYTDFQNSFHSFTFLVILSLCVFICVKVVSNKIDYKEISSFRTYEMYGYAYWFFLTFIYQNQSYRLPIFLILFIHVYSNSKDYIKYFLLSALLLNPVFTGEYIFLEKVSLIANRFGLYVVFSYLLAIYLSDLYRGFISKYLSIKFLDNFSEKIKNADSKQYNI
jgi:hypothetical protein